VESPQLSAEGVGMEEKAEGGGDVESLLPLLGAVGRTSALVLLGFALKKGGLASSSTKQELGSFATTIALPAQVVKVLATITASDIAWGFFSGVVLTKLAVSSLAFACTHVLDRSPKSLSRSAIFAMFSTQSNDYALGLPIASAVFGNSQPHFPLQLYLLAPIQLAIITSGCLMVLECRHERDRSAFNHSPSGSSSALLHQRSNTPDTTNSAYAGHDGNEQEENDDDEIGANGISVGPTSAAHPTSSDLVGGDAPRPETRERRFASGNVRSSQRRSSGNPAMYTTALMQLVVNPIVLSSFGAVALRLVFWNGIPDSVMQLLLTVGNAYPATVLLSLGMSIADLQRNVLQGVKAVQALLLVGTKVLAVAVLASGFSWLISGNETQSEFAFLYGTFPTAPAVPVFAQQYSVDEEVIAVATVVCLAISVPLIATTGLVLLLQSSSGSAYVTAISLVSFSVGGLSLLADFLSAILGFIRRNAMHARSQLAGHRLPLALATYQALNVLAGFLHTYVSCGSPQFREGDIKSPLIRNCFLLDFALELQFVLWSTVIVGLCIFNGLEHSKRCVGIRAHLMTLSASITLAVVTALLSWYFQSEPVWPWYPFGLPEIIISSSSRGLCGIFVIICLLEKHSVALNRSHSIPDIMQSLLQDGNSVPDQDSGEDDVGVDPQSPHGSRWDVDDEEKPENGEESGRHLVHASSTSHALLLSEGFLRHGDWEQLQTSGGPDRQEPGEVLRRLMQMELWLCVYALYSVFNALTSILSETLYLLGSAHTTYHLAVELLHHFMLNLHGVIIFALLGRGACAGMRGRRRMAELSENISHRLGSRARRIVRAVSQPGLL